ncbi:MAG: GW dipeptide domain-containing protein [Calditrichaceae bacterium]
MKFYLSVLLLSGLLMFACQEKEKDQAENQTPVTGHKVKVDEVIQANSYTYLKVEENNREYWMAIAKSNSIKEDDVLYYNTALEMKDFKSKDLDRTFKTIYFVQNISDKPIQSPHRMPPESVNQRKTSKKDESISVKPVNGGITIAELYKNKDKYAGKQIKIKGQVTKYNASIMGKNWVHIQDGTEYNDNYDLTITTQDQVAMGDIAIFEGTIVLDQDFGAGYSYKILMENANLVESSKVIL